MHDIHTSIPFAVIARAAYLRAGGGEWAEIAGKLGRTVTEVEALPGHPDWDDLHKRAMRAVAKEAEAEARLELRRGLRSDDDDEAMVAAEEAYRRQERRSTRRKSGKSAASSTLASTDGQLVQAYLECLNGMSVEEFLALEAKQASEAEPQGGGRSPDANVTPA